jgi:glutaredoxin-like protein NrdH
MGPIEPDRSRPVARIKVFALSTCPHCIRTRAYLTDLGVAFDVVEVDKLEGQERDDTIAEVRRLSGGASFPVIVAADQVIVGFDKGGIDRLVKL